MQSQKSRRVFKSQVQNASFAARFRAKSQKIWEKVNQGSQTRRVSRFFGKGPDRVPDPFEKEEKDKLENARNRGPG